MRARTLLPAILAFGLISCSTEVEPAPPDGEVFGASFATDNVRPAESLWTSYTEDDFSDSVRLTIQGRVDEVCQAKGCWMTVSGGEGQEMKVTFKDYGFFVPKDIGGSEVIMHGVAYIQETPVAELRHFAEDAGASEEEISAIDAPRRELRFLAEGVQLLD